MNHVHAYPVRLSACALCMYTKYNVYMHVHVCGIYIHVHVYTTYMYMYMYTEFEGLYWAEQKRLKEQRAKDKRRLVNTPYIVHIHVHVPGCILSHCEYN